MLWQRRHVPIEQLPDSESSGHSIFLGAPLALVVSSAHRSEFSAYKILSHPTLLAFPVKIFRTSMVDNSVDLLPMFSFSYAGFKLHIFLHWGLNLLLSELTPPDPSLWPQVMIFFRTIQILWPWGTTKKSSRIMLMLLLSLFLMHMSLREKAC